MGTLESSDIDKSAGNALRLAFPQMNPIFLNIRLSRFEVGVKLELARLLGSGDRIQVQQYYDRLLHDNPGIVPNLNRRNDSIRRLLTWEGTSDS